MTLLGREVVVVEATRTPIGRGHPEKGALRDVHPSTLLAGTFRSLVDRAGVDPGEIGDVVTGCVQQLGVQGLNVGRNAWLEAGLPLEVPATTIDRQCGSGQQAVNFAASLVASGAHDVAIGSGVEHMGLISFADGARVQAEHGSAFTPELLERYPLVPQGVSAELIAERWQLGREELDALSLRSHCLAAQATDEGRFTREITPVGAVAADQGIRPDTTLEALATLPAVFREGGVVTAGSSSQVSDGAAAVLLASRERAGELGLRARARIVDHTTVGVDPVLMLTGPIPATQRILERNGLAIGDIDLFEVNEAFAPVVLAWQRETGADLDRVNVNGGAIALGHPLGASGARLVTTLLHELERADKELGLVTMCCGGGLGTATLVQRL